jgi:hypothetical protein
MANKKIQDLPVLSVDDYNPDQDLILIQKPDGASYQMNAINVMNPVAGGVVHLDEEKVIFKGTDPGNPKVFDLSGFGVPSHASTAIISIMQPPRDVGHVAHPQLEVTWFNNSSHTGSGHHVRINAHDRATWAGMQFMCPIINQKIYFKIIAKNTQGSMVLNAYM